MSGGNKKFIFKMHNNETRPKNIYIYICILKRGLKCEQKASGTQSLDNVRCQCCQLGFFLCSDLTFFSYWCCCITLSPDIETSFKLQ